ncbi:MAG: M48 family metalloprotease [Bdellovibrionales bacterium]|nr:M48 family metalloprotease [Bdellovibrionales bacterium]NQZ19894.1 M48 family metalloprotease [Bdellovibrionales bacterium]
MFEQNTQYYLQELDKTLKELTSTASGRRTFLKAMPFLLAACASAPKTRYREGDNTGQATALTVAQERKMTAEVMPKMRKDYPPLRDPQMQRYISNLGNKIVRANGLGGRPYNYTFEVVDVNYVNAFALPAGTVFVTTPLIAMADTEAELAGVVGHEIGHIKARHSAERMFAAQKAQKKTWLYALGGGLAGAALGYGVGKLVCPPRDKKCLQKAATYGGAAGAGGGLLIQKYGFMANSREDEMEADRIGFRTSVKAGYDKDYVGRFYAKLLKMEQDRKGKGNAIMASIADAMSTHPPSRERVVQMNEMAREARGKGRVSSESFANIRQKAQRVSRARGAKI